MLKRERAKSKPALRREMKIIRHSLSQERRIEAERGSFEVLCSYCKPFPHVLSYRSHCDELATNQINFWLMQNEKLYLPKISQRKERELEIYPIDSKTPFRCNLYGIDEPDLREEEALALDLISLILVPALAFDLDRHRLGYGKGYYDRLLKNKKQSTICCGIGYKEQLLKTKIPIQFHDVPLDEILLF